MRRLLTGVIAAAALVGVAPGPAAAADAIPNPNCEATYLPGGVGGYSISVAGQTVRVPKIKNVGFCVADNGITIDGNPVKLYSGCGATCFDVFTPVSLYDPSVSAHVCYDEDGVRRCLGDTVSTGGLAMDQVCVVSVGKPAQQTPNTCLIVISEDPFLIPDLPQA